MSYETLIARLQALKGTDAWQRIAEASELAYFTVARIARGDIENPGIRTCERITDAIAKYEAGELPPPTKHHAAA